MKVNERLLTTKVMQILDNWHLTNEEKLTILELSDIKERHLYQYQKGTKFFEFNVGLASRVKIIFGISEALRTSYPTNRDYMLIWLRKPQKKFKGLTPLNLMLQDEAGMKRVWHFLDCTQSWTEESY